MRGVRLLDFLSLVAVAIFAVPTAPAVAVAQEDPDEVDCESVCRVFPDRAPPECGCEIRGGASEGSGGDGYGDPAVHEIHERVKNSWREMTANVEDYTVVQTASVLTEDGLMQLGPPVVIHFEKVWVEGYPMYRFVSPAELSNREQEARGEPTAGEVGSAMAQAIDLLGGAVSGAAADALGTGATNSGDGGGSPFGLSLPAEVGNELAELHDMLRHLDEAAEMETREDLADEFYAEEQVWRNAEIKAQGPCQELLAALAYIEDEAFAPQTYDMPGDCAVLAIDGSDLERGELASLIGSEYEGYELQEADFLVNLQMGLKIDMGARFVSPDGRTFFIRRTDHKFASESQAEFVPRSQRFAMSGTGEAMGNAIQDISGFVDDVQIVINQVLKLLVNDGPPTREKIAELLAEFMGESSAGGGLPGS